MADIFPWQQLISHSWILKIEQMALNGKIVTQKKKTLVIFSILCLFSNSSRVFGIVYLELFVFSDALYSLEDLLQ